MANENGPKQQITVWSTKAVKQYEEDLDNGIERKDNPFYYGNCTLRRANLLYEYTQEEINELIKCKNDVNYFANHYAYTKSAATGTLEHITMRDYQEDMLNTINDNRFTIIVASRQSGKCSSGDTMVCVVDEDGTYKDVCFVDMFPAKNTLLDRIKKWLYKIYSKL